MQQLIWFIVLFVTVTGRSDKTSDREEIRTTGFWSLVTRFAETDTLPVAPSNIKYVFIITRRGMVVPHSTKSKTYPKNWFYRGTWSPGELTKDGRRLMHKLGRSLFTRYKHLLNGWSEHRIYASSADDAASQASGKEVLNGLFGSVTPVPRPPPPVNRDNLIDKSSLFSTPSSCPEYFKLREEAKQQWAIKSKRDSLYKYLRKKTGEEVDEKSEWYINSPEKVYFLWEILDFERKSRSWKPGWYDSTMRNEIYEVVKDYYKDIMGYRWTMPIYLIGRLFDEMLEGFYSHNRQAHIHVTDDKSFAAFRGILLNTAPSPPEVGETLMVEVDEEYNTRVHSYRPYHSIFNEGLLLQDYVKTEIFHVLDDRIHKRLCLPMDQGRWEERCKNSEFRLGLPSYFAFHEGCDPYWHAYRRAKIEEKEREQAMENMGTIKRAFSNGELPQATSFSYSDTDTEYVTGPGGNDDLHSPTLERAFSHVLPETSSPLSSQSRGKLDVIRSSSSSRMDRDHLLGSAASTTSQPKTWRPLFPLAPRAQGWVPTEGYSYLDQ